MIIAAAFENQTTTEWETKFIINHNLKTHIKSWVIQTINAKVIASAINSGDSGFAIVIREVKTKKLTIATGQVANWDELHHNAATAAHKNHAYNP